MSNKEQLIEIDPEQTSLLDVDPQVEVVEEETDEELQEDDTAASKPQEVPIDPFEGAEWFDYADAIIECGKCGKITEMNHPGFKQLKTGLQLPFIYTIKNDLPGIPRFLSISCSHCNNIMTLKFTESKEKPLEKKEETEAPEEAI